MNTYKDQPVPDRDELLQSILETIQRDYGLDISSIVTDRTISTDDKRQKIRRMCESSGFSMAYTPESIPNIAIGQDDFNSVKNARGSEITAAVSYYQNALNLASAPAKANDVDAFAAVLVSTGLIGIGGAMIRAMVKELAGKVITKVVVKAAIGTVLRSSTLWVPIVGTILLLLIEIALFLANAKRQVAGMVASTLSYPLYVRGWDTQSGDMYVKHGYIDSFMYDLPDKVNIDGVGEDSGIAQLSWIYGEKNTGFYGIESGIILRSDLSGKSQPGLAFAFANPYSASSGVNASVYSGGPITQSDWGSFYDKMYDNRSLGPNWCNSGGVDGWITMDSASGESVYFTIVVSPAST